jgi:hypothetical protein
MFSFFKRPIVINFIVEQVHPDSTIAVIKTQEYMSAEIAQAVIKAWERQDFKQKAIVVDKSLSIESLTDEDLKRLGLMRIPNETTNTQAETTGAESTKAE